MANKLFLKSLILIGLSLVSSVTFARGVDSICYNFYSETSPRGNAENVFKAEFGILFVDGEQIYQRYTPLVSHPAKITGKLNKRWGLLTAIPERYHPQNAQLFNIYMFLIPKDLMTVTAVDTNAISDPILYDKKTDSYKLYVHPLDFNAARKEYPNYPVKEVLASATSSVRTVFVFDPEIGKPEMLKLSLSAEEAALGGFVSKINHPNRIEKSMAITKEIGRAHMATGGRIPNTNKIWQFMDESAGVYPKKPSRGFGGYIRRNSKVSSNPAEEQISLYGLFSKVEGRAPLIHTLFLDSNYHDKTDFVWHEIVKPLVELETYLKWNLEFSTQFHQQNTVVILETVNGKKQVKGISFRDAEGIGVGKYIRTRKNNRKLVELENRSSEENAGIFGYNGSVDNMFFTYYTKLRGEAIFLGFLDYIGLRGALKLVHRSDRQFVSRANQILDLNAKNLKELKQQVRHLERSLMTKDEIENLPKRKSNKIFILFESWFENQLLKIRNRLGHKSNGNDASLESGDYF